MNIRTGIVWIDDRKIRFSLFVPSLTTIELCLFLEEIWMHRLCRHCWDGLQPYPLLFGVIGLRFLAAQRPNNVTVQLLIIDLSIIFDPGPVLRKSFFLIHTTFKSYFSSSWRVMNRVQSPNLSLEHRDQKIYPLMEVLPDLPIHFGRYCMLSLLPASDHNVCRSRFASSAMIECMRDPIGKCWLVINKKTAFNHLKTIHKCFHSERKARQISVLIGSGMHSNVANGASPHACWS